MEEEEENISFFKEVDHLIESESHPIPEYIQTNHSKFNSVYSSLWFWKQNAQRLEGSDTSSTFLSETCSSSIGDEVGLDTSRWTMRPHQLRGIYTVLKTIHTHQAGGCLGHEMGLGKSMQALFLSSLITEIHSNARILILVPASVIRQWISYWREYMTQEKQSKVDILSWQDDDKTMIKEKLYARKRPLILFSSHESFSCGMNKTLSNASFLETLDEKDRNKSITRVAFERMFMKHITGPKSGMHTWEDVIETWNDCMCPTIQKFDFMVVDEIHKACNSKTRLFATLCLIKSTIKLGLSGTPLRNNASDIVSIAHITQIMNGYRRMNKLKGNYLIQRPGLLEWISIEQKMKRGDAVEQNGLAGTSGLVYSRTPEVEFIRENISMDNKSNSLYSYYLNQVTEAIRTMDLADGSKERFEAYTRALRILTALRRVSTLGECSGELLGERNIQEEYMDENLVDLSSPTAMKPIERLKFHKLTVSSKIMHICKCVHNIISQFSQNKVVIFSQWRDSLDLFFHTYKSTYFPGNPCALEEHMVMFHGGMSYRDRDGVVSAFKKNPSTRVLCMTLHSGGLGIDLGVGSHVFLMEPYWNVASTRQAIARVVREGNKNSKVCIHECIMDRTVEQIISDKLAKAKFDMERYHLHGQGAPVKPYKLSFKELRIILEAAKKE